MAQRTSSFVDCECLLGDPAKPLEGGIVPNAVDLLAEMQRLGIARAWVRHRLGSSYEARTGNAACRAEVPDDPRLVRVKMVVPEGERPEFDGESSVARMKEEGFAVAWVHPKAGQGPYVLSDWCAGAMLRALERRRIPTLIELDTAEPNDLYQMLRNHPALPVVLLTVPRTGRHRIVWALARECRNLYVCAGPRFSVLDGLKDLAQTIGAERIVWGSNYPETEGGAAIANLTYSGLSSAEQEKIAGANADRLLTEARYE